MRELEDCVTHGGLWDSLSSEHCHSLDYDTDDIFVIPGEDDLADFVAD